MKQVIQNMKTGQTSVEEVPAPMIKAGSVLVRTTASLVSAGTERSVVEFAEKNLVSKAQSRPDLVKQVLDKAKNEGIVPTVEAVFNRLDQPMTLGYSSAGVVVEVGAGVSGLQPGDRVACAGGNHAVHAEYALVPKNLVTPIPAGVDDESAAFTTLAAVALQGYRLAAPQVGEKIAVIGLGLLGILCSQIAQAAGCQVVACDVDAGRVALANSLGIRSVPNQAAAEAVSEMTSHHGADAVLICAASASSEPVMLAAALARNKGTVISVGAVGLDLDRKPFFEKELTFLVSRSYGPGRYDNAYEELGHDYPYAYVRWTEQRNMEAILSLMQSGKLDVHPLISHRIPISEAQRAYALIKGQAEPYLGVLLTYPQDGAAPERLVALKPASAAGAGKVVLGVLGAGNYATATFLPIVEKDNTSQRHTIVSLTGVKAQHAGKKFGFEHAGSDPQTLLNNAAINAVAVLTPHNEHVSHSIAALNAGKHVFCEKPMAIDAQSLTDLLEVIQQHPQLCYTVGFNRRFAPLALAMHDFFSQGREPMQVTYRVNAGAIPASHWLQNTEVGGGRIIGEGCHFVDFMSFLAGSLPASVSAVALPDEGKYVQDNVSALIRFENGSTGVLNYLANGDKAHPKERVEVFSGGKIAILDDFRKLDLVHAGSTRSIKSHVRQDKGHRDCWQQFLRQVTDGGEAPIPLESLRRTTLTTFAIMESLRTGRTVEI